jgi:sugar-phosphatase
LIFDLDGLLVDSEPTWKKVEIDVFNALGVPLSWELTNETMGMRMIDCVRYWRERFPWKGPNDFEVEQRVTAEVIRRLCNSGRLKPGAQHAVEAAANTGLPLAVATSSPRSYAQQLLAHFNLDGHFAVVHSAERESYGKPHPQVFLSTARQLAVPARDCLVLEDSVNGVLAAKAARMSCIAIPSPELADDRRFAVADRIMRSLEQLADELEGRLADCAAGRLESLLS